MNWVLEKKSRYYKSCLIRPTNSNQNFNLVKKNLWVFIIIKKNAKIQKYSSKGI